MKDRRRHPGPLFTRRQALGVAVATGAGAVLSLTGIRRAMADELATPESGGGSGYARPEALVTAEWLQERRDDPSLVLVGFMPPEDFETGRIPGSVHLDWPDLEVIDTSDASIERWQQATQDLLGTLGITPDSTAVAYDNGTLFSARLWWVLHYLGHKDVHVLDGGFPAWAALDEEIETGSFESPSGGEPYQGTPNPDLLAQFDEVMAMLEDDSVAILDARTPEEYAAGRIPGAVNLNFPLNAAEDVPKFFKPADELRKMYEEIGVTADRQVVPYCSSGVRSAVTAFVLYLLGYENVALYTGSWLEWSEKPDAPKEAG